MEWVTNFKYNINRKKGQLIAVFAVGLLASCAIEDEETFIEDFKDLGLPQYTEAGNNITGAYQNDTLWKSEFDHNPAKGFLNNTETYTDGARIYAQNDSIWFGLSGVNQLSRRHFLLLFFLAVERDFNMSSLKQLQDRSFNLGEGNTMILSGRVGNLEYTDTVGVALNGNMFIRQVDQDGNQGNIAGTFGFDASIDSGIQSFYKGRFDFIFNSSFILDMENYNSENEAGFPVLNRKLILEG